MNWKGETAVERCVAERSFDLVCEGRLVPGVLWTPAAGEARGLLMLGHGGSLHKRADYILSVARRAARHHALASFAIDGPAHGDRRPDGGLDASVVRAEFVSSWAHDSATDEIVADWRASLDAVLEAVGDVPVGYFGLSMGTMMGLPVVAAEPRVRAAVLGLMGASGPNAKRLCEAAPDAHCPMRFLVQWDDELVPREKAFELFDRIGSKDKALRAHPGVHVAVPAEEIRDVPAYLAARLLG